MLKSSSAAASWWRARLRAGLGRPEAGAGDLQQQQRSCSLQQLVAEQSSSLAQLRSSAHAAHLLRVCRALTSWVCRPARSIPAWLLRRSGPHRAADRSMPQLNSLRP